MATPTKTELEHTLRRIGSWAYRQFNWTLDLTPRGTALRMDELREILAEGRVNLQGCHEVVENLEPAGGRSPVFNEKK